MTKSIHNNLDLHKIAEIQPLMQIQQLSLFYNQKPAFKDVTLSIPQNSITAIVGASGCGKSSFLICLNRLSDLIPGCTVSGHIQLGTLNILSPKANTTALRRRIGTIFQKPNPFPMSIKKNITFPLKEHGVKDSQQRHNIVEQVLKDVGLWSEVKDRLQDNALTLSGGQKQRVAIARALAPNPKLVLADEPTASLDKQSGRAAVDLMQHLAKAQGSTILLVTHDHRIIDIADRIIYMEDGQLTSSTRETKIANLSIAMN